MIFCEVTFISMQVFDPTNDVGLFLKVGLAANLKDSVLTCHDGTTVRADMLFFS